MADEKKTYLVNVESNLKKYAEEAAEAKKRVDELKEANRLLKEAGTASAAEIEANNAALKNAQQEYSKAAKMVQTQTAANQSEAGSRKQLGELLHLQMQELGKLSNAYVINAKGVRELNPLYVEQRNKIAATKQAIIDYDKALGDGRSSVGLYSEAIDGAMSGLSALPGGFGAATSGIYGMIKASLAFIATPIGLILTAVAGAIYLIKEAIQSSESTMDKLSAIGAGLSAVFKVLIDVIATFIETTIKAFNDPVGAIKDFGQAIINNIVNRFKALPQIAVAAFTAVKEAIKGNFDKAKEATNDLAKAFVTLSTGIDIKKLTTVTDEMKREYAQAKLLDEQLDALNDREIALMKTKAILLRDSRQARLESEKEGLSIERQVELLDIAIEKQKEASAIEISIARERARISQAQIDMGKSTEDQLRANEELQVKVIELQEREAQSLLRLVTKRSSLLEKMTADQQKHNEKMRELREKEQQEELDAMLKDIEMEINAQLAQNERTEKYEENKAIINAQNKRAIQEAAFEEEFALKQFQLDQDRQAEIDAAEQTGADVALINQKYNAYQLILDKELQRSKLQIMGDFAGSLATLLGKESKLGKMAAVAQATVNTYLGASAAFAQTPGGIVIKTLAAAAAVVSGLANVKSILAVKSGLPGDSGGSAPTSISQNFSPAVGSSIFTQPQLTQTQVNALPQNDLANVINNMPAPKVTVEDINAKVDEVNKVKLGSNI